MGAKSTRLRRLFCWAWGHHVSRRLYAGQSETCSMCGQVVLGAGVEP